MAHFPKPFFRSKKNRWYVQLDGKQINLGPDEADAFTRYHRIMAERKTPVPVVVDTGPADTTEEATFCQGLKSRIKKRRVPQIDRLIATTNKGDGYRLRAHAEPESIHADAQR